jgi:plasmid stabilization system protein ParE
MALPIVWTINALEDYRRVVDYLLIEWTLKVASDFITILEERVDTLRSFPNVGIASIKYPRIRSIVITKHNKLYYRTHTDKIEILSIFDTRQNPAKNIYE